MFSLSCFLWRAMVLGGEEEIILALKRKSFHDLKQNLCIIFLLYNVTLERGLQYPVKDAKPRRFKKTWTRVSDIN